jgi:hypothetical protein
MILHIQNAFVLHIFSGLNFWFLAVKVAIKNGVDLSIPIVVK